MSLEDMIVKKAKEIAQEKLGVDPDEYLGKVGMSTEGLVEKAGGALGVSSFLGGHEHAHQEAPQSEQSEPSGQQESERGEEPQEEYGTDAGEDRYGSQDTYEAEPNTGEQAGSEDSE